MKIRYCYNHACQRCGEEPIRPPSKVIGARCMQAIDDSLKAIAAKLNRQARDIARSLPRGVRHDE